MNKKTVLFVEDDENDINFAMNAFKNNKIFLNYLILAYNGKEAMNYLMLDSKQEYKKIAFYPDLIILDLKLPFINGLEVLKKIKENSKTKNIPVVVFTSSENSKDLKESYDLGANSFVKKPVAYEEFISTVKNVINYWLEINISIANER